MEPNPRRSNTPFEFRPSGAIEFEKLEPAAAAKEVAAPADDAIHTDPLSINFGRRKDHKHSSIERMPAGTTIDWLVAFLAAARPEALCERFPHVANRLARGGSHGARSAQSLQVLADDARWGGAGFPAQVQGKLQRLLQLRTLGA